MSRVMTPWLICLLTLQSQPETRAGVDWKMLALTGETAAGVEYVEGDSRRGDRRGSRSRTGNGERATHPARVNEFKLQPVLDASGRVAFATSVKSYPGDPLSGGTVLYAGSPDNLRVVGAHVVSAVPDETTYDPLGGVQQPLLDNDGSVASMTNSFSNYTIWLTNRDGPRTIAEASVRRGIQSLRMSPGRALYAILDFDGDDYGNSVMAWHADTGDFACLARRGDPAPGFADTPLTVTPTGLAVGGKGYLALYGELAGPGVGSDNRYAAWAGRDGDWQLLIHRGDPVAGFPRTAGVRDWGPIRINNSGTVAFTGKVDVESGDQVRGVWMGEPGNLRLVAREGDVAEAFGDPRHTYDALDWLLLNNEGEIALIGAITDPTEYGNRLAPVLWVGPPGNLKVVMHEHAPAPGTESGTAFIRINDLALNDIGQVAFTANLEGDVNSENRLGLWLGRPGSLELVFRTGDQLELRPGDTRTIIDISFPAGSSANDGLRTFNNRGEVLVYLEFEKVLGVSDRATGLFLARVSKSDAADHPAPDGLEPALADDRDDNGAANQTDGNGEPEMSRPDGPVPGGSGRASMPCGAGMLGSTLGILFGSCALTSTAPRRRTWVRRPATN